MKEYNETEAVALMAATLPENLRDTDAICEVLDLIYDYYDENGDLDIDADEYADEDIEEMTGYIMGYFSKNAPSTAFTAEQVSAMIRAEIQYEESLIL